MSKTTVIILVIVGCLLLAVGTVSLWATLDVFNADRFGERVAEGLQSEAATEAMAGPIVDQLFASYPDMPPLLRGPAEEAVVWLMQRPAFTAVAKETAAIANKVLTTSAEDVIGIDLAGSISNVGSTVVGVISAIDPDAGAKAQTALDTSMQTSEESGRLAIYEQGRTPKLRQISNLAPWLALLGLLGAIALFVWPYMKAEDKHGAAKYIGIGIMVTAVLGFMLFVPTMQGVASNNIVDPVMHAVVGAVVSVFARSYAVMSLLVFLIGLIVLLFNHAKNKPDEEAQTAAA